MKNYPANPNVLDWPIYCSFCKFKNELLVVTGTHSPAGLSDVDTYWIKLDEQLKQVLGSLLVSHWVGTMPLVHDEWHILLIST